MSLAPQIRALPSTENKLFLISNNLYQKTGAELAEAFRVIPPSVLHLDLTCNKLSRNQVRN
jgi:hypothetical protein